jgi:hypothetical protein
METIDFSKQIDDIVSDIKSAKTVIVRPWSEIAREYDPTGHEINDKLIRKDITKSDGTVVKVARVLYGLQKLSTRRMTQMAFAIPVKRIYKTGEDEEKKKMAEAIEAVYQKARIDSLNRKRMHAYFAACEIATIWYPVKEDHKNYGFDSKWKLRCVTYSPMEAKFSRLSNASIYPVFDRYRDMIALAVEYSVKEDNQDVAYFHLYTKDVQKVYKRIGSNSWTDETGQDAIDSKLPVNKIPGIYLSRPVPIWEDTTQNVNEIEITLSRQSDILRRNSAPILKIKGKMVGNGPDSEVSREVYQVDGDGDIAYVTWEQQVDAMKFYTDAIKENIEEELQLPNLSFNSVKDISAITEGARKTLLADAHLKVGDESGDIIEFLDRECNVIKEFLGKINAKWEKTIGDLEVEHVITPFVQNDENAEIEKITKATQKPVMSQKTGIQRLGVVDNVDAEYKQIQEEEERSQSFSVFEPMTDEPKPGSNQEGLED